MFADFMAMLFCSVARRENRRIASYVTVFATPLSDKRARQKAENVAARSIYARLLPQWHLKRAFLVSCMLPWLTACMSAPKRDAESLAPDVPSSWSGSISVDGLPARWLDGFGDPVLSALVQEALNNNFDLKSASARVTAAAEQARIDGAGLWPQLSFAPGYERAQVRSAGFGNTEFGAFQALFDLNWELDVWGRIRAFRNAAVLEAEAAEADLHAARLSLAARTAQSFFELAEAKLQAEVAAQSIKDRKTLVDLVRGRFARGLARGLDLRLALTDLANAEAQLARARDRLQSVTRRFEVLLGRYPSGREFESARLPEPPAALSAGLPSELLARRPDLIAAFERLQAADARLESANKALLPRIALTATGGTRSPALTELVDPRAVAWNAAIGLLQPLFTGGRLTGEIRRNEALVDEALNDYKNTALEAFREVEQALAAEEWLRQQETALREAVEQTEASQSLAVYSYRHGFIEILTLLDSYRSTLNAQSAHLEVKRQLLGNRIALYLALGGSE
ncbi:efflux transporter outer membrane subunit [Methylotuvimicrobium sp. KM2]|uniref:efflux transporter outer membrane subunit n=2 Tax=Methylotuvimicrobium sp. KM2 TaxID=3133976 RepID=UPI003101368A